MAINFTCPHCGNMTVVAPQYAGTSGPCSRCGQRITVPHMGGAPNRGAPAVAQSSSNNTVWIVLLVVFLVIAGLIGAAIYLFYSLVEKASEMAQNAGSSFQFAMDEERMYDIGLAINEYYVDNDAYPLAVLGPAAEPPEEQHSWMVAIEPYIDETFAFIEQRNENEPISSPTNQQFANQTIQAYRALGEFRPNVTNFIGIAGVGTNAATLPLSDPKAGFFGYTRKITSADLLMDGISNTMMVVNSESNLGSWAAGGKSTVRGLDPLTQPYIGSGGQFGNAQGAIVLLVDGSVRQVGTELDPQIFEAMATIHGGEIVDFTAPGFKW